MMQRPPQFQPTLYATLTGPIEPDMLRRVFGAMPLFIGGGVKTLHLLMQSGGGTIADGFGLHSYFKAAPIDLCLYNGGEVTSMAVIAFLGGKTRYASAHATFMVHRGYCNTTSFNSSTAANAQALQVMAKRLEMEDARVLSLLGGSLAMTPERLNEHIENELPIDAQEALASGLISGIRDFSPPPGAKLFNF